MDFSIKFFDEKGRPITAEELAALPVGTIYYRSLGGGPRERFVR